MVKKSKIKACEKVYENLINVAFFNHPFSEVRPFIDQQFMAYGTALDEKLLGWEGYKWMVERQRSEMNNVDLKILRNPVFKSVSSSGDRVLFIEEFQFVFDSMDPPHSFTARLSTILEYAEGKWMIRHFHGSTPDADTPEGNAWPIEEWERRNAELQLAVDKKTIELLGKNRELEIEAALERVRTAMMAMYKSDEIQEVVTVVAEKLMELGVILDAAGVVICTYFKESRDVIQWIASSDFSYSGSYLVPYFDHPVFNDSWEFKNSGIEYSSKNYSYKEKKSFFEYAFEHSDFKTFPDEFKKWVFDNKEYSLSFAWAKNSAILIPSHTGILPSEADIEILKRFAKVFEQTYIRFMDLQKAEAQARVAKIEAALEKIRSHSLAVNRSDEFNGVVGVVFEKLSELNMPVDSVTIVLTKDGTKDWDVYGCGAGDLGLSVLKFTLPYFSNAFSDDIKAAQSSSESGYFSKVYSEEEKNKYYDFVFKNTELKNLPDDLKERVWQSKSYALSVAHTKNSSIIVNEFNGKVLDEDQADILRKFSRVFEQAYIRYLDLQKAEKSARETKIELSLERIRSQVTSMQESFDLFDIVVSMRNEFISLGHEADYFWHMRWSNHNYEMSMTSTDGSRLGMVITVPKFVHEQIESLHQWEKSESPFFVLDLDAKGAWDYIEKMNTYGHYEQMDPHAPTEEDIHHIGGITFVIARTTHGEIGFSLSGQVPDPPKESIQTLVRFAKVFDLAYRRFEDLKSAEAQIREAQIETGLEKLRGRAMAMHRSEELLDLVALFFQELVKLDMQLTRCLIWTFNNDRSANWWMANPEDQKKADLFLIPFHSHPTYLAFLESWEENKKIWEYNLSGELKRSFDEYLFNETELINLPTYVKDAMKSPEKVILTATFNHFGVLQTAGLEPLSDENKDILKRFGMVFDQTYTRFLDLQLAEKQTHQAKIETALERVRARAMAMQEPEELKEVAQVLRTEMGSLGIEELETCSIYIKDKNSTKAECWYALKDIRDGEKKLVNDHFHLDLNDTWVGREMLEFYTTDVNKVSIVMKGAHRKEWIDYCEKHSEPFQGYYGTDIPERTYHLYKFSNGAIGFASAGEISDESWSILVRAASAFSLAYSRFQDLTKARLDLIKLKKEKKRAEDALSELQLTQAQLIHAEKMASLGELTAGIAHEIQNPLNFVNNFSEVSTEMIDEANEEMEKGDVAEVKYILQDLKGNLEKITHHGKRAESIVKGMLMHSRTTKGEKVPTNINALCDEFLRLSYHGLRAKDRTFNADFETHFDETIPKIEVIPQDIGRVMLNLINNAFCAASDEALLARHSHIDDGAKSDSNSKAKSSIPLTGLEALSGVSRNPKVIVETKLSHSGVPVTLGREGQRMEYDQVQIIVSDNGPGIPEDIKDKIFQPFFTTKPTGQGTGLGLSLAYDIVKAHGGELNVKSKVGEGSEFVVIIPISDL